jgi:hypothetical protein
MQGSKIEVSEIELANSGSAVSFESGKRRVRGAEVER